MTWKNSARKGNTLVMVLAILVVFGTVSISVSHLIEGQAFEVQMILAKSKVEYAAYAGLVHSNIELTEDVSRSVQSPMQFNYRRQFCVAWISQEGLRICDEAADPNVPCCEYEGKFCSKVNTKGTCLETNQWKASYDARYDSTTKSIISSGKINFEDLAPAEGILYTGNNFSFSATKEMGLAWE